MVKNWAKRFREGREDVSDDPRSGRPISVLTVENIECVRQVIEDDPYSTYEDIIVKTDLSRQKLNYSSRSFIAHKIFINKNPSYQFLN
ncbi:unnamed protein product [Rotaria sordida]|uniref:Transposase n=1 Tax=Rotaria sordida TaxID=392033 RepID=A0A818V2J7_9BILA|nr:unnamed protein product [Rotaria sordida]